MLLNLQINFQVVNKSHRLNFPAYFNSNTINNIYLKLNKKVIIKI